MSQVHELVGVYRADGGALGELRYVVGHMLGTTHCALCDITHSWRRKPEWDAMVARIGLPFELAHLNEVDTELAAAIVSHGAPAVFGRTDEGLVLLLGGKVLDELKGSVPEFESALRAALGSPGSALSG